jgi:hypothetical protein
LEKAGVLPAFFDFLEVLSPHCRVRRIALKNWLAAFTVSD